MAVQWFPGHMAKTTRLLKDLMPFLDAVIDVRDARIPLSSRNPLLEDITGSKPSLTLLNKADKADPLVTSLWVSVSTQQKKWQPFCAKEKHAAGVLLALIRAIPKAKASSTRNRPMKVLIAGVPNVGKSTIINLLAKKTRAKVADVAGFTRQVSRYEISDELHLYDSPGLLWFSFDQNETGYKLAALGSIKESVFQKEEVSLWIGDYLKKNYPSSLENYLESSLVSEKSSDFFLALARKRGFLRSGGELDVQKAYTIFLKDLQNGKLGRISLEKP